MPASLGQFGAQLIGSLGGKPTKQSQKLFRAWQQREGGWTANAARFNPLNLTAPGSGLPTINSVGVVAMPNMQAGVKRTASLIKSGYPAIAAALRSGQVNFQDPALQADLNRWVSGQRAPGMSKYVSGVASAYGQNFPVASVPTGGQTPRRDLTPPPPTPVVPQKPRFDPMSYANQVLGSYAAGGRLDFTQLPGVVQNSYTTPPPAAPVTPVPQTGAGPTTGAAPSFPTQYKGKELVLPTSWKSTHVTDGLSDQGFTHAEDIMGHPGTPVGAPEEGTVLYFHPTGAQGGGSMMIKAASGRTYWLGHIANGVPAGTKVKRGEVVAAISGDHPRPHVHIDWSTSYGK